MHKILSILTSEKAAHNSDKWTCFSNSVLLQNTAVSLG